MKIKNIMFGGVMAAILMSVAGAANAADPISVASTGYVDAKVGVVDTKVGTIPQGGFTVGSATYSDVATAIKALDTKTEGVVGSEDMQNIQNSIATLTGDENKDGSVKQQINAVKTAQAEVDEAQDLKITANENAITKLNAGAETDGSVAHSIANAVIQQSQVKDLETALGGKADKTTIGDVPADKTVVQMITEAQSAARYDDAQVKADIAANTKAITDLETGKQAKLTADNLKSDGAANVSIAENGVITISATDTTYTAGTNVTLGENNSINVTMAESVATGGDAAVSATQVQGYAIPKPGTNCQKTTCVLTVDKATNEPYWMELAISVSAAE